MSNRRVTQQAQFSIHASSFLFALSIFAHSSPLFAQDLDGEVSMQRFDPAPGAGNFLTTRTAAVEGHMTWTAGMLVNYGYEPFTVTRCEFDCIDEDPLKIKVVENMVTADVLGSFSLFDRLQLGLKIPVTWAEGHGIQNNPPPTGVTRAEGELNAIGLGDIQLEAKGRFFGNPGDMAVLGAYVYGTAPMGTLIAEGSYIGTSSPSVGGAFIFDGKLGPFTYGANLGGIYRSTARIGERTNVGPEGRWSVGLGYEVSPILGVVVDAFGATDFNTQDLGATSAEIAGGARILPLGNQLSFLVGGGAGLYKGVGVPTARAFLGISYNAKVQDRDGDGIVDSVDQCPDAAEDFDGFEDSDGCPELDNDQDGIPDELDKCPNEPEDFDGFEDKDGCPDPDNDKDGIPDVSDACPDEPETMNGVNDLDGCPDVADRDGDGIPDDRDQCPDEPEDTDGFEDTDGCPDPDNDGDGIPDEQDECIDLPEDGKGKGSQITDGCPIDA